MGLLINRIPDIDIRVTETNNPCADGLLWSVYGTFYFDRPSLIAASFSLNDAIYKTYQSVKFKAMKKIGNLENHYGNIFALVEDGKYYWGIGNYNGFNKEEIPAFLYTSLMKFGNIQSSKPPHVKASDPAQYQALLDLGKDRQFSLDKEIHTPSYFLPIGTVFIYNTLSNEYSATTKEKQLITYKKSEVEGSDFFSRVYSNDQLDLVDFVTKMRSYWKGEGHKEVIDVGIRMLKHFPLKEVKKMIETISDKVQSNYE